MVSRDYCLLNLIWMAGELNKRISSSFCFSFLLHAVILTLLAINLLSKSHFSIPTKHVVIIDARLYQPPRQKPQPKQRSQPLPIVHHQALVHATSAMHTTPQQMAKPRQQHVDVRRHQPTVHPSHHRRQKRMVSHRQISGKQLNKLVLYLYQVISKHKRYPAMSRQLDQQGVVQVAFTLLPNGQISNLHVVHSSGYRRLDQAAVATLRASVPFSQVSKYMQQPQQFVLPIAYRLAH